MIGRWLARLLGTGNTDPACGAVLPPDGDTVYGQVPEGVTGFGYKCTWLAIRCDDRAQVARSLGLEDVAQVPWQEGIQRAANREPSATRHVFALCPAVDGWVLVYAGLGLGLGLSLDSDSHVRDIGAWLAKLSAIHGTVYAFGSYRVVDYVGWMRAEAGLVTRAFAYADGVCFANEGVSGKGEADLGYDVLDNVAPEAVPDAMYDDMSEEMSLCPSEEHVISLAAAWSVDPLSLPSRLGDGAWLLVGSTAQPQSRRGA